MNLSSPTAAPLELAALHRSTAVGAAVRVGVPTGVDPGRLLAAAGFRVESVRPGRIWLHVDAVRLRTLPDIVAPGMRLLICGLNPSLYAADAGVNFARPGNRFWPAALAAGIVSRDRDPWDALVTHGVGWSDLVKRATVAAGELTAAEYTVGTERLAWTVELLKPGVVCFVGLTGWRAAVDRRAVAGKQPGGFAGARAYVMPNTSGLNARTSLTDFTAHLRAASRLAD